MSLEDSNAETVAQLAQLSAQLASDPSTRKEFLRLTKKVRPDVPFAELDIDDRIEAATRASDEKYAKLEKRLEDERITGSVEKARSTLRTRGLGDEEIAEVEKTMMDHGIADHEKAADFHRFMREQAAPTPEVSLDNRAFKGQPLLKDFLADPKGQMQRTAFQILHQMRKPVGQARF